VVASRRVQISGNTVVPTGHSGGIRLPSLLRKWLVLCEAAAEDVTNFSLPFLHMLMVKKALDISGPFTDPEFFFK
jgi:hypothetical protein